MPRFVKSTHAPITPVQGALIESGFRPSRQAWAVRLARRLLWPLVRPFHFYLLDRAELNSAELVRVEAEVRSIAASRPTNARLDEVESKLLGSEAGQSEIMQRLTLLETDVYVDRLDRMERRLDSLEHALGELSARLSTRTATAAKPEELSRLEATVGRVRSELIAISNRHVRLEEQASATSDQLGALAARLSSHLTDFASQMAGLIADDHASGQTLKAVEHGLAETSSRLQQLAGATQDTASRLSEMQARLDPLQHGLFLTHATEGIFLLQAGELISESVRNTGVWDSHIISAAEHAAAAVRKRNGPSDLLAIDVGGHFGLISVPLARIYDRVVTFEPNAFNATLLRANIVLNGLVSRVEVRREALAATAGTVSLAPNSRQEIPLPVDEDGNYAPAQASNLGAYSFVPHGTGMSEARALALDTLALDGVAFIKIDVQGGDGTVLLGAMDTIIRCRPWVIFEWEQLLSRNFAVALSTIEEKFASAGYRLSALYRHNAKQVDYLAIPEEEFASRPAIADAGNAA